LTVHAPLAGAIVGAGVLTGGLTVHAPLAGTVAGTSTFEGTVSVHAPLAGNVAGASSLTGAMSVHAPLAGNVAGTSSLSGTLTNTAPPAPGTPLAFTNNLNTTVTDLGSGVYRITKTSGTDEIRNARANSNSAIAGDFLITLHAIGQGDVGFTDGFVGANDVQLTTNAPSSIEVAFNAENSAGSESANAQAPGGTTIASSGTLGTDKVFMVRTGSNISFRKGAAWNTATEYATASMSGSAWCSVLLDTINGYVEVTFQPIE
ncbi:MAG: hypothetical protein ACREX8_03105, partial [Gammaproteobacteria bacterium]